MVTTAMIVLSLLSQLWGLLVQERRRRRRPGQAQGFGYSFARATHRKIRCARPQILVPRRRTLDSHLPRPLPRAPGLLDRASVSRVFTPGI